jgi:hypothetical protein
MWKLAPMWGSAASSLMAPILSWSSFVRSDRPWPTYGVAGALADPTLELHDSNQAIIATNDDWMENSDADQQFAHRPRSGSVK